MRRRALHSLLVLCALPAGLAACNQVREEDYPMIVRTVELPASVGASAPLDVVVEVEIGGCHRYKRLEGKRAGNTLTIRAIGTGTVGKDVACPAFIGWEKHTYTDPGTPARTGPFEVVVNGKSYGKVAIQ